MVTKTTSRSNATLPKTGKIGSLVKNIQQETNRDVVLEVMRNVGKFESTSDRAVKAEST